MNIDLSRAQWFKSSRSSGTRECVEVAFVDDSMIGVRDSKDPGGPALAFTPGEWDAFTDTLRNGGLDRPFA
ncbi:DUF397 domain-containing protein [Nocardia africana]|uniref:DUF397 domain-containing protein n=1 Tax=Nocardia africana TaxID=134964 RepID=A0ABW6NJC9_9NOCA